MEEQRSHNPEYTCNAVWVAKCVHTICIKCIFDFCRIIFMPFLAAGRGFALDYMLFQQNR